MNLKAIEIQALLAVLRDDPGYGLRKTLRWYSKTFSTPLADVEEMPLEDVFQAYYEEKLGEMDEDALEGVRKELLESPEDKAERMKLEDAEQADADQYAKMVEEEEAQKKKKPAERAMDMLKSPKQGDIVASKVAPLIRKEKESNLPSPVPIPPDITMQFAVDPDEFEKELEGFGLMDQPKRKK